ncbi:MAG: 2-C-methyl-D-erythritol 4-phosphate cytidylyltransferase [Tannerella sp.]|jgi:2-C-methyl-D-erythritol 4-phosphate cytidylyltransferase|nr:2-C-methyl-D-erythritol 4-phosphate cytidylyltransferase [Tannerella sp.]
MKRTVIIVAGGKGMRMGGGMPKQFVPLQGKPVLMHTLEVFYQWDAAVEILLVIPEEQDSYWRMLCKELDCHVPHRIVYGGDTRFHSVRNGLKNVTEGEGIIAVHDGVRPFVSREVISSCFAIAGAFGAAVPAVPMIESVREINGDDSRPFDRNRLCIVQTPQVFRADLLRRAYGQPYDERFTDDASLVEATGHAVRLVDGNRENIKITTPVDLKCAEFLLAEKTKEMEKENRTGEFEFWI